MNRFPLPLLRRQTTNGRRSINTDHAGKPLRSVDWTKVALLSAFAFVAALLGNLLGFRHRLAGAILTGVLFAAAYIFWTYYPHGIVLPGTKPA